MNPKNGNGIVGVRSAAGASRGGCTVLDKLSSFVTSPFLGMNVLAELLSTRLPVDSPAPGNTILKAWSVCLPKEMITL